MSYGLQKQISKLDPKMGYFGGPNKALTNMRFKRPNWSHLGRGTKREGEEEEEEKKRRGEIKQKGMETEFMYGFYEIMYEFPCFDGYPLAQI